jgi:hypothetical protein
VDLGELLSDLSAPRDAVSPAHFWLRVIGSAGNPIDLDPPLRALPPGTHLGTEDTAKST